MVVFKKNNGEEVIYLNPWEKTKKYAKEVMLGCKITNRGEIKKDRHGAIMELTEKDKGWRSGYAEAVKENYKIYKHKQKKAGASRNQTDTEAWVELQTKEKKTGKKK